MREAAGCRAPRREGARRRLQLLLKCADISNVAKPLGAAREWGVAVTDEVFAQGDMERALGIEVPLSLSRSHSLSPFPSTPPPTLAIAPPSPLHMHAVR